LRRPDTVRAALVGVERMYLAPLQGTTAAVLAMAAEAGVQHVVDLSGEHESWWGGVTRAVEAAGVSWTHLWPGDFMENAHIWAPGIVERRTVREPRPHGRSAPIAMDDVARVAAAALRSGDHVGTALTLTGPEVLTRVELTERIAAAIEEPIRFEAITRDESVAELTPTMGGSAAWYVDAALAGPVDNPIQVTTTVADGTGRPATTFAQWAIANADAFRG
jgi:Predicted nucleoside-diphosphate-sugar epimerases